MNPTPQQLAKLPKWAQEHVQRLERELENTKATLKRLDASQMLGPVYVDEWHEPRIRRYVPVSGGQLVIEHADVKLRVHLARKGDGQRLYGIELVYESTMEPSLSFFPVALVPRGSNSIQLVHKDNLV